MEIKKNGFTYFSLSVCLIATLYALVCSIGSLGVNKEYPYFLQGVVVLILLGIWISIQLLMLFAVKLQIQKFFLKNRLLSHMLELFFVAVIVGTSVYLRIEVIKSFPVIPESDYKNYYEIADFLSKQTLMTQAPGYCDYIAMFPHVIGYPYVLSIVFNLFGTDVLVAQYFNVVLASFTVVFVWRTARAIGGRIAGTVAIVLCAFWPSQILYNNFVSSEYLFTFLFSLDLYLFVILMKKNAKDYKNGIIGVMLHIVLGILIALTSAIRPMGLILLAAIILCIFTSKMKLENKPRNDLPLMLRVLEKGWLRCVIILIAYMLCSQIISFNISATVNRQLPSAAASFGYNLLVGLNAEHAGGWNQEDADLLYSTFAATSSAQQAHIECRNKAFDRVKQDPPRILNLFVKKYNMLWGNDDYASEWNMFFLRQQSILTKERENLLYSCREWNNCFYILALFLTGIAVISMWRRKGTYAYVLVLVFLGTVAAHILLESQNRYHYYILQVFAILAAVAVSYIYLDVSQKVSNRTKNKEEQMELEQQEHLQLEQKKWEEEKIMQIKSEMMQNTFDMQKAIEQGHVVVTVSEAYKNKEAQTHCVEK